MGACLPEPISGESTRGPGGQFPDPGSGEGQGWGAGAGTLPGPRGTARAAAEAVWSLAASVALPNARLHKWQ